MAVMHVDVEIQVALCIICVIALKHSLYNIFRCTTRAFFTTNYISFSTSIYLSKEFIGSFLSCHNKLKNIH